MNLKKNRLEKLEAIAQLCCNCPLRLKRNKLVFGEGNIDCKIMLLAEAPGAAEDFKGRPLIGPAGTLLRAALEENSIALNDVYLANIIKCRPPLNRTPEEEEILTCIKLLKKQIEIISPSIIVLLGRTAVKGILPEHEKTPLEVLRQKSKYESLFYKEIRLLITYHPSAVLRDPHKKSKVNEDFQHLKQILEENEVLSSLIHKDG